MVTPSRKQHLILDAVTQAMTEPAFRVERSGADGQMCLGQDGKLVDTILRHKVGYQLRSVSQSIGERRTNADADAGVLTQAGGGVVLAAEYHESPTFYQDPDGDYPPGAPASADTWAQKRTDSGAGSNASEIAADRAAYDGLSADNARNQAYDRAMHTVDNQPGYDQVRDYEFGAVVPNSKHTAEDLLAAWHFVAPFNVWEDFIGYGNYCLALWGDGTVTLYERGTAAPSTTDFDMRLVSAKLAAPHYRDFIRAKVHIIPAGKFRGWPNGGVQITVGDEGNIAANSEPNQGMPIGGVMSMAGGMRTSLNWVCRAEPPKRFSPAPAVPTESRPQRMRIDVARNARPRLQLRQWRYVATGTVQDGPICIPFLATNAQPLLVQWESDEPSGCAVDVQLYDADTGAALTPGTHGAGYRYFATPTGIRYVYAKFTLTGNTTMTPTLSRYAVQRDPVYITSAAPEVEVDLLASAGKTQASALTSVTVTGQGPDVSEARATFKVEDIVGRLDSLLLTRGRMDVRYETEFDALHPTKRAVLFRGECARPIIHRQTSVTTTYGTGKRSATLNCGGPAARASRGLAHVRFDFGSPDPATGSARLPYKATDAINYCLQWDGYPPGMIATPDWPVRLYSTNGDDFYIEPLSDYFAMAVKIARRYLGARLLFDENAGSYGKWRLFPAPLPPYNNLAHFTTSSPGSMKQVHNVNAYGLDSDGLQLVPIFSGVNDEQIPIEFNRLVVTATGQVGGPGGQSERMTQIWHNFRSFNFLNLPNTDPNYPSPSHPDYCTVPIEAFIVDPGLYDKDGTGIWVNWALRRTAAIAGHTVRSKTFVAPLALVTDASDTMTTGAGDPITRALRYYDAVKVDGVQYLVRNVELHPVQDQQQLATYEVEAPREDFL